MKFQLLAAIITGATLTQVGASPLRVVVVSSQKESPAVQNLRFGHALADSPVAKLTFPHAHTNLANARPAGRRPCGKRIKDKAIEISNAFRHALGLPAVETAHPKPGDQVHGGMVHILPFIGTPPTFVPVKDNAKGEHPSLVVKVNEGHPIKHPHHHFHHHAHKIHEWGSTFWMRIHNALMALGPWEGRAVAFVLGCGIGVLLRMFWVLSVVTYRSICGDRDDGYTQVAVIEEYVNAEDIVVPPPTYTIVDEKDQVKAKDTKNAVEN